MAQPPMAQPLDLPPNHVYQGGAAPGAQCASCRATSTSGSWRRGWHVQGGGHANLCNRCGQRFVKLGKLASREAMEGGEPAAPARPKAPRPAPAALPANDAKRTRLAPPGIQGNSSTSAGLPSRRLRLLSETISEEEAEAAAAPPPPRPSLVAALTRQAPWQPQPHAPQQPAARPAPPVERPAAPRCRSYCVQRQACGRASLALFWVQDARGGSTLAAVGVDRRGSGHFTYRNYAHALGLGDVPPLRCTNRAEVVSWLATALGAERAAPEAAAALPDLGQGDLQRLLAPAGKGGGGAPGRGHSTPESAAAMGSASQGGAASGDSEMASGGEEGEECGGAVVAAAAALSPSRSPARGGKVKPWGGAPRFSCGACGRGDHSAGECPLGCGSPPALVDSRGAGALAFLEDNDDALRLLRDDVAILEGASAGEDSPMQDTLFFDTLLDFSLPQPGSPGGAAAGSPGAVTQPARRLTPAAAAAFQHAPHLMHWVSALPPAHTEASFAAWADRLGGHIADAPPPAPASAALTPLGGTTWVPTAEALGILRELGAAEVNLALLERTRISRAVAMLRTHPLPQVAQAAEGLVARWRTSAVEALSTATAAGARPAW